MDRRDDTDPRLYQIACLTLLLTYGVTQLAFDATLPRIALNVAVAQAVQWLGSRWVGVRFDPISALTSSLSMSLLLRTNHELVAVLAGVIAIGSKFFLRVNGKHVFNPTNLGIGAAILLTGEAWISPGQWGSRTIWLFAFACLGGFVTFRSLRQDITIAFLAFWAALIFGRSYYVGEPISIPIHRMESGSLLLFAFFMISDPKTTPDSRLGRVLFAGIVALAGWYWQFQMYQTNGAFWALMFLSPLVPLLDRWLPGARFEWPSSTVSLPSVSSNPEPLPAK